MNKLKLKSHNIIAIACIISIAYIYNNPNVIKYLIYIAMAASVLGVTLYNLYVKNSNQDIENIDTMSGVEFEKYLVNIYRKKGYKVNHVGGTGDYGADLILKKDNETIIIQAKRYNNNVGVKAVQEVISAKSYYQGTKAMVVTNSYFTPNAINMARRCNVQLIDRNKLIKLQTPTT